MQTIWPSHSPDLTLVEQLWHILEQYVRQCSLPLSKYQLSSTTPEIFATEYALACFGAPTPY